MSDNSSKKLAVGGDSAGGYMTAVITLRDREEQTGLVRLQVLLYPAVNISGKVQSTPKCWTQSLA